MSVTTVTQGTYDSDGPEWRVTVLRSSAFMRVPIEPLASDYPTDVLRALIDWASEGLVGRAKGSPE